MYVTNAKFTRITDSDSRPYKNPTHELVQLKSTNGEWSHCAILYSDIDFVPKEFRENDSYFIYNLSNYGSIISQIDDVYKLKNIGPSAVIVLTEDIVSDLEFGIYPVLKDSFAIGMSEFMTADIGGILKSTEDYSAFLKTALGNDYEIRITIKP